MRFKYLMEHLFSTTLPSYLNVFVSENFTIDLLSANISFVENSVYPDQLASEEAS